ncbi:MAG: prepilin-type N-terminal cleavage/methylation domain-containing protein [Verrucomicrobia bacterium]|nr:prepilin-type N-terminal cleavage/methylation domain-containing protein [Verrucomicrobiota bacterium]
MLAFPVRGPRSKGFTLIELLVVIGIIGILVGVLAGVLGGGDKSAAMQSAQGTLSSLLSSARAQAALTGRDAAVAVNFNPTNNSDRYLRYCVVIVRNATNSSQWDVVNEGYYLPAGVYIVPPTPPTGAALEAGVSFTVSSTGFDTDSTARTFNSSTAEGPWLELGINSLGGRVTVGGTAATGSNVVLALANPQPPGTTPPIKFSSAYNIRGFSISKYGVASFINDANGFN